MKDERRKTMAKYADWEIEWKEKEKEVDLI